MNIIIDPLPFEFDRLENTKILNPKHVYYLSVIQIRLQIIRKIEFIIINVLTN